MTDRQPPNRGGGPVAAPSAVAGVEGETTASHGSDDVIRKIVVGVDGSATANRALEWAAAEAEQREATLVVVLAWDIPALAYGAPGYGMLVDRDELASAAAGVLDEQLAHADLSRLTQPAQSMLVQGHAGQAILDAAIDAELIVVGSRGHGELTQLVIGSVSQHVLHHARVPVVVVPQQIG